jgi:NAD(P)-dependent dehydrogenase (short-subunit alcohol dehydrogenase family)
MSDPKIALVTGASSGFGRLIAQKLRDDGYRVFGTMRDIAGRNADAKRDLEAGGIAIVEMDVTDDGSVDRAAASIFASAGHVDVLVNNAGTAHMGAVEGYTPASLERQFATNVVGPIRVARAFLPSMRERKSGLIIFVSSVVGRLAMPFTGVYTASKWAIEALAETLSYEVRPHGVDIAIVQPGAYATNIFNAVIGPDDPDRLVAYGPAVVDMTATIATGLSASARNPVEVSDAIAALAAAPAGTRPLRTPVPANNPAAGINAAVEPLQRSAMVARGMGALLPSTPVTV